MKQNHQPPMDTSTAIAKRLVERNRIERIRTRRYHTDEVPYGTPRP